MASHSFCDVPTKNASRNCKERAGVNKLMGGQEHVTEGETKVQSQGILGEKIWNKQISYILCAEGQPQVTEEQKGFSAPSLTVFHAETERNLDPSKS